MPRLPVLSPMQQQYPVQRQLYEYILEFKAEHDGNSPSRRQMADRFNASTSVVTYWLEALALHGFIRIGNGARMIEVIGAKWVSPLEVRTAQVDHELLTQFDAAHR